MPHMDEETTKILHNIISLLIFKYREDVKTYFFSEPVEDAKENYWENTLKRVIFKTDNNMVESE